MKTKQHKENVRKKIFPQNFPIKKGLTLLFLFCLFYSGITAQITAGFELDGNATSVATNPPDDWDRIFNGTDSAQVTTGILLDNDSIFQGGGSKDDLDINNWAWTTGTVPDKDDILHGGVALYNNCKLYFFADRYAIQGSANIGFWLFKSNISLDTNGTFNGLHTVGDVLLVSEFVNGGGTSIIKAYKWVGSGGNTNGTLDSIPVNGTNSYAISNSTSTASPWPFNPKTGPSNIFGKGAFFEGGIDLCSITGLDPCFTSFLIETRASWVVDAVLKDFLNGSFTSSPQVTLNGGTRCIDGPAVTLNPIVTGGIRPFTYLWSPGGSTDSSITVSPIVPTTYTVTVTGLNGCAKSDTATISVSPSPNANAGIDKVLTCTTTSIALSGSSSTAGATFSWAASAGGNIFSGALTATPTVDAAGTYILTVTKAGCTAKDTALVTLNNTAPNASAGIDKVLTCTTTSIALSGSSSTAGATFSWAASAGGNIVSGSLTATPTVDAGGTYVLTVTNPANGCTAKDTAMVTLNNTAPNANAGIDKVLTCTTTSIALSGSSSTAGATFSWAASAGGNIVSGALTATPTVDAAGTYVLTVTNPANGCTAKDTALVTLNNTAPNVDAGIDKVLTCTTTSIALSGSSSTAGATFSWAASAGGNIVSGALTATPTVDAAGTYVLTVTNPANGCTAKDTALVTLNNTAPNANAGIDKVLTCTTTSIALSGSSSTAGATFSWAASAGGNIVSGALTATPTVDAAGTYVLTVTNPANGCTAKDTAMVTLNNTPPNVNAGIDKVLTCTTTSIALSGSSSTAGATFSWAASAGGNIVSGALTATPTVDAAGTYVLTVTNPANGCTAKDTAMVTLNNTPPNVNAGIDKVLTCTTTSIALSGSSSTAGATFSWAASAGGNIVSGALTATPTVDAAGTYVLTVTNPANGCTAKDTALVTLNNTAPNANAGIDKVLTCTTTSIALSGSSSTAGATFSWAASAGGNIVSGALTATPTVDAAGTYVLTVTNPANGCTAKDTALVTLNNTAPNANAGIDKVLTCTTTSIALSGSSSTAGATFSWAASAGGNIVSGALTATPTVDAAGTYVLTVTNPANGCTAKDTALVTQDTIPPVVNIGNDTTFLNCHAPTITLDAGNPGATYLWNTAEITQTITVSTSGVYYVRVTNTQGCSTSDTINITIIDNNIDVDLGPDTTVCQCIVLDAGYPTASHVWCSGQNYQTINACVTGTYCVTVSNGTCTDSDTIQVTVNPLPVVDLGNDTTLVSQALLLDAGNLGASYLWSTGATTQTIIVTVSGQYYVTVMYGFGCIANDTINVTITVGINENTVTDLNMNVSPNPSSDKTFTLSFNISEKTDVEIRIVNVLGKVVYSEELDNFSGSYHKMIKLKDLAPGIYFTDVLNGTKRSTVKLILE